jgi:hypothetical protein
VNFLLLCYRKKINFLALIPLDIDEPFLQNPQVGRSTSTHRIFSFLGPKNTNRSFYFPIGKSAPTKNLRTIPLALIRKLDITTSSGQWSNAGVSNPQTPMQVNADPSSAYRDFPYHDFSTRDIKQVDLLNSYPRCVDTPMHTWVDYSTVPSPRRDFGLRGIANSNAKCLILLLFLNSDNLCHLSSTH